MHYFFNFLVIVSQLNGLKLIRVIFDLFNEFPSLFFSSSFKFTFTICYHFRNNISLAEQKLWILMFKTNIYILTNFVIIEISLKS